MIRQLFASSERRIALALIAAGLVLLPTLIAVALRVVGTSGDGREPAEHLRLPDVAPLAAQESPTSEPTATVTAMPLNEAQLDAKFVPDDDSPAAPPAPSTDGGPPPTGGEPPSDSGGGLAPDDPAPSPGAPPTATPIPDDSLAISIVAPQDGATVPPTFTVQVAVSGIQLALGPNGSLVPGAAHWHVGVDRTLLPGLIGSSATQVGPLEPGTHQVTVTLNLNELDNTTVAIDQIQVTVR